ncbi:MAG: hypothetical protein ABSF22_02920 [Bryobacteraceae bacterium]
MFGSSLASQTASASTVPFSTSLGSVTVTFTNGSTTVNAPISYVSPTQMNAQVPWELVTPGASATTTMVVSNNGVGSSPTSVPIGPFGPGIFGFNAPSGGIFALAYTFTDSMFAWPTGSVPGLTTHPAAPGSVLIVYATGLGAVTPAPPADGAAAGSVLTRAATPPIVLIGGMSAEVEFAGLTPTFPGVYQLNIVVPPNAPAGSAVPLQVQVGGLTSPATFTIAIGN